MIKIYFIRNIIFKLLIDSVHRLRSPIIEQKSLERASDEKPNDFRGRRGLRDHLAQFSNFTVEETEDERG